MKSRTKKVIGGVLALVIGIPAVLLAILFTWFYLADETNGTVVSAGLTRHYLLYVPETYNPSTPTPLLVSMHGAALWPAYQMKISRWNEVADEHGFIVVYPAGGSLWGGTGSGPKIWLPQNDMEFISDLIGKLESEYNIDSARIYADGLSLGGAMAFAVSCQLSHRMAAVGAVAAAVELPFESCDHAPPMPLVAFHGTADPIVPYQGGAPDDPFNPTVFPAVLDWVTNWAGRNRCEGDPVETQVAPVLRRLAFENCAGNAEVVLYTVEGGGHTWPGGDPLPEWWLGPTISDVDATRMMWEFFRRYRRAFDEVSTADNAGDL